MSETEFINKNSKTVARSAVVAAVFALIGLIDAAYLTAKHFTDKNVPCNIISGCEMVLKSEFAEMFGIPTAAYGAVAYFIAFSLAVLTFYGNSKLWNLFGLVTFVMFGFTIYLLYLQGFVINAFCQFCLLSAVTTTVLFTTYAVSVFLARKQF